MVNEYHVECTSDRSFDEHRDSFALNGDCSMTRRMTTRTTKDRWPIDSLNRTSENRQRHQQHSWPSQDWRASKRKGTWSSLIDLKDPLSNPSVIRCVLPWGSVINRDEIAAAAAALLKTFEDAWEIIPLVVFVGPPSPEVFDEFGLDFGLERSNRWLEFRWFNTSATLE